MIEPYNIKLISYANGTYCMRVYDNCINGNILNGLPYKKVKVKVLEDAKYRLEHPLTYNPFTDTTEYFPTFEDLAELERKKNRSISNSLKRTLNDVYKYSRQAVWEYFITLTFDGNKVDRYDFNLVMGKARKWFNNQKNRYAPDLKYLYVPEMHKDGAYHIHGLISDVGKMLITDSGRVSINGKAFARNESNNHFPTIYNLSGWTLGFSTATCVTDTKKVSTYITKYITKDLCKATKNKHRFYRSANLSEPEEYTFAVGEGKEDFIQKLVESLGVVPTYEKVVDSDYNTVTYKYYEKRG